ncbi:MAG TPA: hypothetical protein DDZ66_03120 [Firmicutes bacterium]|nr:hypothetical protein [Bacillota bacterium]
MPSKENEQRINCNIYGVTIITVVLGVVFYSGFRAACWPYILILTALQMYLAGAKVSISERTDISLGSSAVLPVVYLCGATPAMLISVLLGIYDGVKYKKEWRRTMFNAAQFAFSALMMTLSFEGLSDLFGHTEFGLVVAASVGTVVYIVFNIGLVCRVAAIWSGVSWWAHTKEVFQVASYSSLSSGFIGIIFTFFVMSFGFWGLVVFSILLVNLSGLLESAAAVSVERDQRRKLEEELIIDEMTGACNFRYLNNWLSEPSREEVSILFMDIDDFSVFNNTYGHAEGDRVLKLLVETINKSIRTHDRVIRYGGDEFVVFLQGMDAEGAICVAERIIENLGSVKDAKWNEPITVSLGIAAMPRHTVDKRQLLLFADQAMYQAKELGKNKTKIWGAVGDPA